MDVAAPPPHVSAAAAAAEARRLKVLARGAERLAAITIPCGRAYSEGVERWIRREKKIVACNGHGPGVARGAAHTPQRVLHRRMHRAGCGARGKKLKNSTHEHSTLTPHPPSRTRRRRHPALHGRARPGGARAEGNSTRTRTRTRTPTSSTSGYPSRPGRGGRPGRCPPRTTIVAPGDRRRRGQKQDRPPGRPPDARPGTLEGERWCAPFVLCVFFPHSIYRPPILPPKKKAMARSAGRVCARPPRRGGRPALRPAGPTAGPGGVLGRCCRLS